MSRALVSELASRTVSRLTTHASLIVWIARGIQGFPVGAGCTDFTYVWSYAGFCYVSFVVDAASWRILGWNVDTSTETPMVTDPLDQSLSLW